MFDQIQPTNDQITQHRCNSAMRSSNELVQNAVKGFKGEWKDFWPPDSSVEMMQAQLDLLATTPCTDQGVPTNALSAFFAKALRWITYLTAEMPDAFSDSRTDKTGNYHEFLTPGWIYTIGDGGMMIVSAPCEWIENK